MGYVKMIKAIKIKVKFRGDLEGIFWITMDNLR